MTFDKTYIKGDFSINLKSLENGDVITCNVTQPAHREVFIKSLIPKSTRYFGLKAVRVKKGKSSYELVQFKYPFGSQENKTLVNTAVEETTKFISSQPEGVLYCSPSLKTLFEDFEGKIIFEDLEEAEADKMRKDLKNKININDIEGTFDAKAAIQDI